MPITSSDLDLLNQLSDITDKISKAVPWITGQQKTLPVELLDLATQVFRLRNLHKKLASQASVGKILLALHGDQSRSSNPVVVQAASVPLKVFLIDHRVNSVRRVDVVRVAKTATDQDFSEAVHDEIADYVSLPRDLSSSDLKRIIEELN